MWIKHNDYFYNLDYISEICDDGNEYNSLTFYDHNGIDVILHFDSKEEKETFIGHLKEKLFQENK
jgi:hypothetical protein